MLTIAEIILVVFFILLGGKWYLRGTYNETISQLVFIIPLILFVYIGIIHLLYNQERYPKYKSGIKKPNKNPYPLQRRLVKQHIFVLVLYVLLIIIGLFRTAFLEQFSSIEILGRIVSFLIIVFTSFFIVNNIYSLNDRFWIVLSYGLGLYVAGNFVGWLLGINNSFVENQYLVRTDTLFGFMDRRAAFPFAATHQSLAVEAGILILLTLYNWKNSYKTYEKVFSIMALLISILVVLFANSRTPMVAVPLALLFLNVIRKKNGISDIYVLVGVLVMVPFLITVIDLYPMIKSLRLENLLFFTRSGNLLELATLNNRTLIWRFFVEEFRYFQWIHLMGYGAFGQVASGLSQKYGFMWPNPELITLHNAYFQNLVDIGYFGLLVFLFLITNLLRILRHCINSEYLRVSLLISLYLVTCSAFDLTIYFNQSITIFIFFLLNFQAISVNKSNSAIWTTRKNN